jgi:dUTPase
MPSDKDDLRFTYACIIRYSAKLYLTLRIKCINKISCISNDYKNSAFLFSNVTSPKSILSYETLFFQLYLNRIIQVKILPLMDDLYKILISIVFLMQLIEYYSSR